MLVTIEASWVAARLPHRELQQGSEIRGNAQNGGLRHNDNPSCMMHIGKTNLFQYCIKTNGRVASTIYGSTMAASSRLMLYEPPDLG